MESWDIQVSVGCEGELDIQVSVGCDGELDIQEHWPILTDISCWDLSHSSCQANMVALW